MPLVAIAGGTSQGPGRSIVTAITKTYPDQKWKPIILSRSSSLPQWAKDLNADIEIRTVDYKSPTSLTNNLENVHTIISVILAVDDPQATCQIALLDAAMKAGCKRFVPSEWACGHSGVRRVDLLAMSKPLVWEACEKSGIEWARFNVGCFMNYLGIGCGELLEEACFGVDREGDMEDGSGAGIAEIVVKDDGTWPRITMTEIGNVGEFVAAALDLEEGRWERDMDVAGCTIRFDRLVELVGKVRGIRFQIKKLGRKQMEE